MKKFSTIASLLVTIFATSSVWAGEPEAEAEAYLQTWEERGREACEDNEPGCAAAGNALDKAAAAYEKAGRLDKAITIRKMILDPKWHIDYTDYGRAAAFALARNYQSIVEYEQSAQIVETAVRRFPKSDEAPGALKEAFQLRVGLGQLDRAFEDFQTFQKIYGDKRQQDVCALVLALGTTYWKQEQPDDAANLLEKQISFIDRRGTIGQRLQAHALLGRIYERKGDLKKATAQYDFVRAGWKDPEQVVRSFYEGTEGTREEKDRRLGLALMAVGEAQFFFAEQKRLEVEAISFPKLPGAKDKDALTKFINTQVAEWLTKKRAAIEDAENAYRTIIEIQPLPPPKWVIASASRVGDLWSSFVSDFSRVPVPKEWSPEIRQLYRDQSSSLAEPILRRAKAAFEVCASQSVKFQHWDDHARSCVEWLSKHYPKQWVPIEEFMPTPDRNALPILTQLAVR